MHIITEQPLQLILRPISVYKHISTMFQQQRILAVFFDFLEVNKVGGVLNGEF